MSGFPNTRTYRYWDKENRCLDIEGKLIII